MSVRSVLEQERRRILKDANKAEEIITASPEGRIRFEKNGKHNKWKHTFDDKPAENLSKSKRELAEKLALKTHMINVKEGLERQNQLIEEFLKNYPSIPQYPNDLRVSCKDYRELLDASLGKRDKIINEWLERDYKTNPDYREGLIVPTRAGIKVRSKAEEMIADALFERRIPFHYEELLDVGGINMYPDFTILDPVSLNKEIIWEHFGMMDDRNYASRARIKIGSYLEAGWIPDKNLIMTFEGRTWPLDINYVELLISHFFERGSIS